MGSFPDRIPHYAEEGVFNINVMPITNPPKSTSLSDKKFSYLEFDHDQSNTGDYGRVFPDKLCVSSFPDRIPHYAEEEGVFIISM